MRLEDAKEIVWLREWTWCQRWGFAEIDPAWRRRYLETMEAKCAVLGLLVEDCLRTSRVYRLIAWLGGRDE